MKLLRFVHKDNTTCHGILRPDQTIDLLEGDLLAPRQPSGRTCPVADILRYLPPVDPPNLIALGGNYREHCREGLTAEPSAPLIFLKAVTSLNAHRMPIVLPRIAPNEVDYEAELAIVIGKRAKNITPQQTPEHILGYTCANDVSARDCQIRLDKQWARGKSFDTFAPLGPVVQTELDPAHVRVRSILNGQCMQDETTAELIFPVPEIVSYISQNMTLLPGTVILTGTPAGVGYARRPKVFLKPGDQITIDIDGIGSLENTVQAE